VRNKLLGRLLSPNLWVGVSCVLAGAGIVCVSRGYRKVGVWLFAPLLVGGVIVVFALIPMLIRANRKHHDQSKSDDPENRL
jgi:TRAP-type C4-dicarboxylate transport system permease small subunit